MTEVKKCGIKISEGMSNSKSRKQNTSKATEPSNQLMVLSGDLPKDSSEPTCLNCKYWFAMNLPNDPTGHVGQCRQGPPSYVYQLHPQGPLHTYRLTLSVLPACQQFLVR